MIKEIILFIWQEYNLWGNSLLFTAIKNYLLCLIKKINEKLGMHGVLFIFCDHSFNKLQHFHLV